ncbi:hypothetical protein CRP6_000005 [Riemerella phage vB_RanS_CRP6]|nr:hypothetical protein CRP5_000048 [Riemerella phage vB_RanS_CRP5]WIL01285.1 hypothetical protein CRP6_000005 [Riemerella phage vB_RanS_CRP6]
MVIISKYLVPRGYTAMAVFPFIFLKNKEYQKKQVPPKPRENTYKTAIRVTDFAFFRLVWAKLPMELV